MSSTPVPSATVVVIRDGEVGLQVLLHERNTGQNVWVFPGGKVDADDGPTTALDGWVGAGRRAAVREANEEASLTLDPDSLVFVSRWVTPPLAPKRFDTLFFLGAVDADEAVRVDGSEISDHRWLTPAEALVAQRGGSIRLAPPTFVTVTWLADHATSARAARELGRQEPIVFRPEVCPGRRETIILYPGDAGYVARDPSAPGRRHRLRMEATGLRYERDPSPVSR